MAFPVVQFITVGRLSTFSCPFKFSDSPTERSSQFPNQLSIPPVFFSFSNHGPLLLPQHSLLSTHHPRACILAPYSNWVSTDF